MNPTTLDSTPNLEAIKTRQQSMWASGDYGQIGVRLQIVGEALCEAVDVRAFERVIDVAAGNGNASLAAARRFAQVIATDYVPELLEQARRRAEAEQLPLGFRAADAENLPFSDGEFSVALSVFGVMFTPNQERAASELLRVVRPAGRIGLANWTPDGFVGQMLKLVGSFGPPPPAGLRPASAWGSEPRIVELFGPHASDIKTERKPYLFRFGSAEHFVDFFRQYYGPVHRMFGSLDEAGQKALQTALVELVRRFDRGGETMVVPSEYLEVVITR